MVNPTQVPVSGPLAEFGSGFASLTCTSASVLMLVAWERGGNSEPHRSPKGVVAVPRSWLAERADQAAESL